MTTGTGTTEAADGALALGRDGGFDLPEDGGGGEGGGGGGREPREGPGAAIPISAAKLGMLVLLSSLVMLFAGFVTAYVVLRSTAGSWPPAGSPPLPWLFYATTGVLLTSSITMAWATSAARRGARPLEVRLGLAATTLLGLAFVGGQTRAWLELFLNGVTFDRGVYGTILYSITGVHAAHVLGGVVVLTVVLLRALRGRYDGGRATAEGVELAAMYWHFVDLVWVFLFAIL